MEGSTTGKGIFANEANLLNLLGFDGYVSTHLIKEICGSSADMRRLLAIWDFPI